MILFDFLFFYLAGWLCRVTAYMCEPVAWTPECQVPVEGSCNILRWKNNLTLTQLSQFAGISLWVNWFIIPYGWEDRFVN